MQLPQMEREKFDPTDAFLFPPQQPVTTPRYPFSTESNVATFAVIKPLNHKRVYCGNCNEFSATEFHQCSADNHIDTSSGSYSDRPSLAFDTTDIIAELDELGDALDAIAPQFINVPEDDSVCGQTYKEGHLATHISQVGGIAQETKGIFGRPGGPTRFARIMPDFFRRGFAMSWDSVKGNHVYHNPLMRVNGVVYRIAWWCRGKWLHFGINDENLRPPVFEGRQADAGMRAFLKSIGEINVNGLTLGWLEGVPPTKKAVHICQLPIELYSALGAPHAKPGLPMLLQNVEEANVQMGSSKLLYIPLAGVVVVGGFRGRQFWVLSEKLTKVVYTNDVDELKKQEAEWEENGYLEGFTVFGDPECMGVEVECRRAQKAKIDKMVRLCGDILPKGWYITPQASRVVASGDAPWGLDVINAVGGVESIGLDLGDRNSKNHFHATGMRKALKDVLWGWKCWPFVRE